MKKTTKEGLQLVGAILLMLLGIAGAITLFCLVPPTPPPPDPFADIPKDDVRMVMHDTDWKVVEIEGCEYFYQRARNNEGSIPVLCHKGNCKNPIHMYNVRMEK